jgi:hypothetical protein
MKVGLIYASGQTNRYQTEAKVMEQQVDAHSWGVAAIIISCHPDPSANLLKHAILHDCAEWRGPGDISYRVKSVSPILKAEADRIEDAEFARMDVGLPALTEHEDQWLKWADMAEVALHSLQLLHTCGYPCTIPILQRALKAMHVRVENLNAAAKELNTNIEEELNNVK